MELATFGTGCFWCTEAVFQLVKGVKTVTSGYTGGQRPNPTYDQICSGATGHAEVVQIEFDDEVVQYSSLLEVFFGTHDPTTLNRQGNDAGTQYRSVIYYHNDHQKSLAEKFKKELNESGLWDNPVITEISLIGNFYEAEKYHQNYFVQNPGQGYCAFVVKPKIDKLKKVFADILNK